MSDSRPPGRVRYDNSNRVVMVTGGAGGIGRAISKAFARSGASVVCLDIQSPDSETEGIWYRSCDTSSEEDCRAAIEWTLQRFSAIDVLVNNAAIQPAESYRPIHELSDQTIDRMLAINFRGYLRMAQLVVPTMLNNGAG